MRLSLIIGQFEIELSELGGLWLKTARHEFYVTRCHPEVPWWPYLEREEGRGGMWTGFGREVMFNRVGAAALCEAKKF